ncbi:MAG TPA: hypothetical protein VEA38_15270 [Terriglobales bacterium]|nr:hypothetical protein [Terriglobales bacterium]
MSVHVPDPHREAPGVNEMIDRDRASWEKRLREKGGDLYDASDLEGVIRQVSYARNVGKDPDQFLREQEAIYDRRRAPTASAGGRGGDADVNGDGALDAGWARNPNKGEGRAVLRASELPTLADLAGSRSPYTQGPGWGTPGNRGDGLVRTAPLTLGELAGYMPPRRERRWWGSF